jgi:cytochrome c
MVWLPAQDYTFLIGVVRVTEQQLQQLIWRNFEMKIKFANIALVTATTAALLLTSTLAHAVDEEAAKALARQNNCFKCHSVEKDKDGPAYKKVAEKFRGKPDAEARLIEHVTSGEKAKFPDGHEEEHKIVKTSPPKDMAQIKNLIDWILSQ